MKLIKKIAAIMFAFMMVFSLGTNVKAQTDESGVYGQKDGKIVIDNAVVGNDYTIYRLLKLESYSGANYSYTLEDGWRGFIQGSGSEYLTEDENGYITFNSAKNKPADMRLFAEKALAYAKTVNLATDATRTVNATSKTVTFDNLPLGYYVVGSTVGSLCELNTTDKVATIKDKNEQPSVVKKIVDINNQLVPSNSMNIGDTVTFNLTINVKPGAKNYIVHDKMDSHLKYVGVSSAQTNEGENIINQAEGQLLEIKSTNFTDGCAVEFSFTQAFYNKYRDKIDNKQLTDITLIYGATVLNDAPVKTPMKNTAHLTFGDNNTESEESETTTYTFSLPVFKYTGTGKKPLAGAKFKLYTDEQCKNEVNVKLDNTNYFVGTSDESKNVMTSPDSGEFNINGLKAGTYYLKEIEAPKGYNLLAGAIEVHIDDNGKVQVKKDGTLSDADKVEVENKTGTVLPSTGGAGTTMIYLIGAVLVLGSGVVLATKRRVKNK